MSTEDSASHNAWLPNDPIYAAKQNKKSVIIRSTRPIRVPIK